MAYTSPTWNNESAPAINASSLQALTDTVEASQVLSGVSDPTSSTAASVGQFYLVTTQDSSGHYPLWQCVGSSSGVQTWKRVDGTFKVLRGTYTGTGTYGVANPTTISIGNSTNPALVTICGQDGTYEYVSVIVSPLSWGFTVGGDPSTGTSFARAGIVSGAGYSGGILSFYAGSAWKQMNVAGKLYFWCAICER